MVHQKLIHKKNDKWIEKVHCGPFLQEERRHSKLFEPQRDDKNQIFQRVIKEKLKRDDKNQLFQRGKGKTREQIKLFLDATIRISIGWEKWTESSEVLHNCQVPLMILLVRTTLYAMTSIMIYWNCYFFYLGYGIRTSKLCRSYGSITILNA